jgi:hypothetical protein
VGRAELPNKKKKGKRKKVPKIESPQKKKKNLNP